MTHTQLERAVARATGESRNTIRRHGFSLIEADADRLEDPASPQVVDWDDLDDARVGLFAGRPTRRQVA